MKRHIAWFLLALSLMFNVFFLAGYLQAKDQANQNTSVKQVTDRVATELGLDDEQIALYQQLRSGFSEEMAAIDDELAVVEFELLGEMRQPKVNVDVERVREFMDRQVELRHQRYRLASDRFGRFLQALSPEQRKEFCGKVGRRHAGRTRRDREMIERFDANGDGKVDGDERQALKAHMEKRWAERMQQDLIQRFDADGDGELNAEESQASIAYVQRRRADRQQRHWMARFDADGDGKLDGEEWRHARRAVASLDKNGDDELDAEEWRAALAMMGVRSADRSPRGARSGPSGRRGAGEEDRPIGQRPRRPRP